MIDQRVIDYKLLAGCLYVLEIKNLRQEIRDLIIEKLRVTLFGDEEPPDRYSNIRFLDRNFKEME